MIQQVNKIGAQNQIGKTTIALISRIQARFAIFLGNMTLSSS